MLLGDYLAERRAKMEQEKPDLNYEHRRWEHHQKCYDQALECVSAIAARYDHWVLTLSAGSLVVSLTFLEKIAPNPDVNTLKYLVVAWTGLIASLGGGFCALYWSQQAADFHVQITSKEYEAFRAEIEGRPIPHVPDNPFNLKVTFCNKISACAFVIGLVFLCVFSFINLQAKIKPTAASLTNSSLPFMLQQNFPAPVIITNIIQKQ